MGNAVKLQHFQDDLRAIHARRMGLVHQVDLRWWRVSGKPF
jgi:hypothetical protein